MPSSTPHHWFTCTASARSTGCPNFSIRYGRRTRLSLLGEGRRLGYDVPNPADLAWLRLVDPRVIPSEWLTLDLGAGELAALALGLENPNCIVVLDDALARRIAHAAGLQVWGTLRVLIEAKSRGWVEGIAPLVTRLADSGMWISDDVRRRILALAGESR